MNIKNPERVLGMKVIGRDGHLWQICEVSKLWDSYDEPFIQFNLLAVVDINSTIMRNKQQKAELKIYNDLLKHTEYYLICNGAVLIGDIKDINTKEKFLFKLQSML